MAKIAISYRRSDSQDITGRIFDRLVQQYGKNTVFRDIDSIQPGIDFRTQIAEALASTDVLLVMVGPRWFGQAAGARNRIESAADPVRIEVETALKRSIPIIPVLVGGMRMPEVGKLPASLGDLAYRHAVTVDGGRDFDHHVEGLIRALDRILGGALDAPSARAAAGGANKAGRAQAARPSSTLRYGLAGGVAVVALGVAVAVFRVTAKPPAAAAPVAIVSTASPLAATAAAPAADSEAARAWAVTKDSTSIAVLDDFIRQFGDTPYASMARARVDELTKAQAASRAQPMAVTPQPSAPSIPISASPNFDCSKSRAADELEICRSGELSVLDRQLNAVFAALRSRLPKDQQVTLEAQEQIWLKQRAACMADAGCIGDAYRSRIAQLQTWH
jgi:uncharacterized protein YecT (DUF1311 family)